MSAKVVQMAAVAAGNSIINPDSSSIPQAAYNFTFTPFLRNNSLAALASNIPVCPDYAAGSCPRGRRCSDRHPTPTQPQASAHHYGRNNDNYVCKHWLKGLCKKGDSCDYLHEYNLRKMSECQFYNQNGFCQNGDECLYVHVKEDSKLPLCEDYNAGFCEKGPRCGKRHVRRKICEFYMAGFCPDGRDCKHGVHLRSSGGIGSSRDIDKDDDNRKRRDKFEDQDRRDDDNRKEGNWRGRGSARGGRWRDRKRRG